MSHPLVPESMPLTTLLTLLKDPSYQETIKKPLTLHPDITCCNLVIWFQQQIPLSQINMGGGLQAEGNEWQR